LQRICSFKLLLVKPLVFSSRKTYAYSAFKRALFSYTLSDRIFRYLRQPERVISSPKAHQSEPSFELSTQAKNEARAAAPDPGAEVIVLNDTPLVLSRRRRTILDVVLMLKWLGSTNGLGQIFSVRPLG
jgi:hypothetical protein